MNYILIINKVFNSKQHLLVTSILFLHTLQWKNISQIKINIKKIINNTNTERVFDQYIRLVKYVKRTNGLPRTWTRKIYFQCKRSSRIMFNNLGQKTRCGLCAGNSL